jgi:hypothetical protein
MLRLAARAAILAACLCGPAIAQGMVDPQTLSATQPLTPEQRKKVADFFSDKAERLATANPEDIGAVRKEVIDLLKSPALKDVCRRECAAELVRAFKPLLAGNGEQRLLRATNVFIIARHAPVNDTMAMLLDAADPAVQQDAAVRVAASAQLPLAIRAGQFAGPQAEALAKRAAAIGKAETNWIAAAHDAEAVIEALRTKGISPAQAESIAMMLGGTVNDLTTRTFSGGQPDLINALQRALLGIRNQTSEVAATARAKLFTAIGPSLDKVAGMKGKVPAAFGSDSMKTIFESVTNTAELLNTVRSARK